MTALVAFHNNPAVKDKLLADLIEYARMDRLVQGHYWENGKGCAIGCTLHSLGVRAKDSGDHSLYETKLGIPVIIARLEDRLFERLTNGKAKEWPIRFTRAIQPGADLSMVWPKFVLRMLSEELPQYVQQERHAKQRAAIEGVAKLYREWCASDIKPDRERFVEARANAAAAYAADAYDAAAYAAAARSRAQDARSLAYERMADKLIELLSNAPMAKQIAA